ncbi:Thioredoxin superfamily protein [Zea mays]|nr:Thioredoxin superfamily protein [Zea mays]
MFLMEF